MDKKYAIIFINIKNRLAIKMTIFNFSLSQIYPLLSMAFILSLGILVFYKNSKAIINRLFFIVTIVFGIWQFGTFMMFISSNDKAITFWDRFIYLGVVFMPAFQYHFSLLVTHSNKIRKIMLNIAYVFSIFFLFLSRTDYFVHGVYYYKWGTHTIAQIGHHFFLFFFFFYIFSLLYNFYCHFRDSRQQSERYRMVYFTISFAILNLVGGTGYLPAYKIGVYPISLIAPLIFSILITYAIIRYRLMDIKVVIKKSLLYALLVIYVAGAFTFISLLIGLYLHQISDFNETLVTLIISLIIVLSLDPLKKYLGQLTDKIFFKAQIDYRDILKKLSEFIAYELDLRNLLERFIKILTEELKLKKSYILLLDKADDIFKVESYLDGRKSIEFDQKNPLIRFLKKEKEIIIYEELERKIIELEQNRERKDLEQIGGEIKKVNASLCVPIFSRNDLTAILFLGEKLSGDMYTQEDLNMFEILAPEIAAALEKAKLYEETKKFGEKLKVEVEKATADLMLANDRLKQLDQSKTEFIYITSHQLRTPLSGLKGFLSMLLEGDFGELDQIKRDVIKDLLRSAERLVRTVNLFLDISRIEVGKLRVEKKKVSIENLITEVIQEFIPEIDKKGLTIQFKKPEKSLGMVKMDRDKIKDAILNLVDNSIKYTEKGEIIIKAGIKNKMLEVAVEDTGMGIAKEDLPQLFAKFSRGSNRPPINPGGSGLGLFVVKKIIDLHEGEVWAESEGLGKGSRFIFRISV